jgi:hypothetical protein
LAGWLAFLTRLPSPQRASRRPDAPLADELPPAANTLDHHERAVVVDVVRALLSHRHGVDEWKAAIVDTLHGVGSDLLRIKTQLNTATAPTAGANEIISLATQELAQTRLSSDSPKHSQRTKPAPRFKTGSD